MDFKLYQYESVAYKADKNLISNYLKVGADKKVGIYIKGQDNPYAIIDKDSKTLIYNSNIESATFGMGAEATRIKACAVLNTLHDLFIVESGWDLDSQDLGRIACRESALDNRKKDKISVDSLI